MTSAPARSWSRSASDPGALTIGLLRAVGPTGRLVSYELREDFAAVARENVARFHGDAPNWTLRVGDALAGIEEREVDRLVVDLAEPWRLLDAAFAALRPGGVAHRASCRRRSR